MSAPRAIELYTRIIFGNALDAGPINVDPASALTAPKRLVQVLQFHPAMVMAAGAVEVELQVTAQLGERLLGAYSWCYPGTWH